MLFEHISSLPEPENCLEETLSGIYGEYIWAETFPQIVQEMVCRKPRSARAYRLWCDPQVIFILHLDFYFAKRKVEHDLYQPEQWANQNVTKYSVVTVCD